ncbi:hypothetical protein, partial [Yersinia ruckeri]|uniref:hypothetical protein n=1 Tax=Yersinia ruckeri TaxID=29486 RepID=UPI002237A2BC
YKINTFSSVYTGMMDINYFFAFHRYPYKYYNSYLIGQALKIKESDINFSGCFMDNFLHLTSWNGAGERYDSVRR